MLLSDEEEGLARSTSPWRVWRGEDSFWVPGGTGDARVLGSSARMKARGGASSIGARGAGAAHGCPWQRGLKEEVRGCALVGNLLPASFFLFHAVFCSGCSGWKAPSGSVFPEHPFSFVPTASGLLWSQ